jgi:hypothetical protein
LIVELPLDFFEKLCIHINSRGYFHLRLATRINTS